MSLYHNKQLGDRLAQCGPVDQYVRLGPLTLTAEISLSVQTDPAGLVHVVLSLDLCNLDHHPLLAVPLAIYPLIHQSDAQDDALLVAKQWGLELRRATDRVGWEYPGVERRIVTPSDPANDFKV
jgi:hypothetical protein